MHPEEAAWATTVKTNSILADIYDILSLINSNLTAIGSGKRARQAKPYPRPGSKNEEDNHIGTPVPIEKINRLFGRRE